ncbi:MAG: Sec-independent protein translocase subunit TatA/TatB [Eggerthellaceae bacterium]
MFGISAFELFLILLFGFLIFGPDKLPAIAQTLGKAIGRLRDASQDMNRAIKNEVSGTSEVGSETSEALKRTWENLSQTTRELGSVGRAEALKQSKNTSADKKAHKKAEAVLGTSLAAEIEAKKEREAAEADGLAKGSLGASGQKGSGEDLCAAEDVQDVETEDQVSSSLSEALKKRSER